MTSSVARLVSAVVIASGLGFAIGLAVSGDPEVNVTVAQPAQPEPVGSDLPPTILDPSTVPAPTGDNGAKGETTVTAPKP